eukprot:COSAG04_NODE_384_length_15390_cov_64.570158_19_plen_80_part_00
MSRAWPPQPLYGAEVRVCAGRTLCTLWPARGGRGGAARPCAPPRALGAAGAPPNRGALALRPVRKWEVQILKQLLVLPG